MLELPVVFSLSGAEGFAKAGVAIASAFDCTNHLAFGSESGDCELLKKSASAVCDERVQALVRQMNACKAQAEEIVKFELIYD